MKIASLPIEAPDMTPQVETTEQHRAHQDKPTLIRLGQDSTKDAKGNQEETADLSLQKLENMTGAVESYLSSLGVNLKFNIDERTDMIQVEVRDPETNKLIRKIPADEMLDLAASIEQMVGLFLNKTM